MSRKTGSKKPKNFAFSEAAYTRRYDPAVEGYGNPRQWRGAFNERMGFEEAQRVKSEAQSRGKWRPEHQIIADTAGVPLTESSMWSEIKSAFRKATMNCHPDRIAQHGKDLKAAEAEFKEVAAAFTILEQKYGKN